MQPHSLSTIRRMCEFGARPSIIRSYFWDVNITTIRDIYREAAGEDPPKGQLPDVTDKCFDFKFAVQSSVVAKVYSESINAGASKVDALIHACEMLTAMFKGCETLSFSYVWLISRNLEIGQFGLQSCTEGHTYLRKKDLFAAPCPVCKEMRKLDLKIAREVKKRAKTRCVNL